MPPTTRRIEEDEDSTLNEFLDDLIVSAHTNVDATQADATSSQNDQVFSSDTLHDGIESANVLLQSNNLPALPTLDSADEKTVLASSLSFLIRILRANSANLNLRQKAEASLQHNESQLQTSKHMIHTLREKLEISKDNNVSMKQKYQANLKEKDSQMKKNSMEITELRTKLQTSLTKQKTIVQDIQRKEKELALLKQRVHTLISSPRGHPVIQRITPTNLNFKKKENKSPSSSKNSKLEINEKSKALQNSNLNVINHENDVFRDLLRATQEELDDLVIACDSTNAVSLSNKVSAEKENDDNSNVQIVNDETETPTEIENENDSDEEKEEDLPEDSSWDKVLSTKKVKTSLSQDIAPAPTEDQMRLPFEMIREEFEESLEKKFQIIRTALTNI